MKRSLKHGTGYLMVDHRDSPGVTAADVAALPGVVPVPGGTLMETDVYQCSHCQRTVMLQAAPDRMHLRGYCPKCDHYVCNACEQLRVASGGACVPFKQVLDRAGELAEKFAGQPDHPDARIDVEQLAAPGPPRIVLTDLP